MTPGRGRVLLRRVESGESYPGGTIIIPETVRDALMAQHAEVVAVGAPPICDDETCPRVHHTGALYPRTATPTTVHVLGIKPGDWVLVAKRAGVECGDETGRSYLANIDDVLAVLQP